MDRSSPVNKVSGAQAVRRIVSQTVRRIVSQAGGLLILACLLLSARSGVKAPPVPMPAASQAVVPAVLQPTSALPLTGATLTPAGSAAAVTAPPAAVTPAAGKAGVLRINLGAYPDLLDPQKSAFVGEIAHLQMIYEGLTRLNEKLETVPGAAEKWEYNADATGLVFSLRPELRYSDGSVLNAKRFAYALLRNIDPATAGQFAQVTDVISGAAEWHFSDPQAANAQTLKTGVQVAALDASGQPCTSYEQNDCLTLQLGFAQPAPYFHTVMSLWVAYPAKEENITAGGEAWWNSPKYHQPDSSEARNNAASDTSSGVPRRWMGWVLTRFSLVSTGMRCWLRSVRIVSGAMQLTRIPNGPTCAANSCVRIWMPALAAA